MMDFCHVMILMNALRSVSKLELPESGIREPESIGPKISDRNQYQETHNCHPMADCINTDFSYECRCKKGYFEDADGCFDADECVMKTHRRVYTTALQQFRSFWLQL